jgi:hypothetical protein
MLQAEQGGQAACGATSSALRLRRTAVVQCSAAQAGGMPGQEQHCMGRPPRQAARGAASALKCKGHLQLHNGIHSFAAAYRAADGTSLRNKARKVEQHSC